MSYTVVIDEREREQRFENRLNVLFRHCRIGRIQRKVQIHGGAMVPSGRWAPTEKYTHDRKLEIGKLWFASC